MEFNPDPVGITQLLEAWQGGSREALDRLIVTLYRELKRIAAHVGAEQPGDTLQATVIVNELYLRLLGQPKPHYENRAHFFSSAARAMRQIRVDHFRHHNARKRGGSAVVIPLESIDVAAQIRPEQIETLDQALDKLSAFDARKSSMMDLRYFSGFSVQEVANALSLSTETVRREMRLAEAWLMSQLQA